MSDQITLRGGIRVTGNESINILLNIVPDRYQPKKLSELAFTSFTKYIVGEVLQLVSLVRPISVTNALLLMTELEKDCPISSETLAVVSRKCIELKRFFHGMRLPASIANELTGYLINVLDDLFSCPPVFRYYTDEASEAENIIQKYFLSREPVFRPITEVFIHRDVTEINLGTYNSLDSPFDKINSCEFIVPMVLREAHKLPVLKALNLRQKYEFHVQIDKLVLPPQLEELTLCEEPSIAGEGLRSVVESCPELKHLKLTVASEEGIHHILKCKHLETLHLIGTPEGHLEEACVKFIEGIPTDKTSDRLCTSSLRSFGLTLKEESTLRLLVSKLPMLTEIVLCLMHDFDLFSLTQLKNLRSLRLDILHTTSNEYKKILPDLGKNLVSLDLRHYYTLDIECIGETCNNLKYLCLSSKKDINSKPPLKMCPNFKSVQRLKVNMPLDFDWTEFIIAQCVNLKVLDVTLESDIRTVIDNIVNRTPADSLEEIRWLPMDESDDDVYAERVVMYFKE